MEDIKPQLCRFCRTIINDQNRKEIQDDTKEILGVLLLQIVIDVDSKLILCNDCSAELCAAQRFKRICLDTEESVSPYIDDTTILPIDLRDIYIEKRETEHPSVDVKICRLCMEPVKNVSEIKSINEEQVDMIQKFVPEMDIFVIKEPIMCKPCEDSLALHCSFLKKCSDVEQNTGNVSNVQVRDVPSPVPLLGASIKMEVDDYKSEDEQQSKQIEFVDVKIERDICSEEIPPESAAFRDDETQSNKSNLHSRSRQKIVKPKKPKNLPTYKCENCDYVTKYKMAFTSHLLRHKEPQIHKCENCAYSTKRKKDLKQHMLKHKDVSEVPTYKCEICNFITKRKSYLRSHMLKHKDLSEVETYKCKICTYETKYKTALKSHMLSHKDPSEVEMYKCEICYYETKRKGELRRHILMHKDPSEVQMYACNNCDFKSKFKINLKLHLQKHKDISQVQMYKCDTCDYESRDKGNLKKHHLTHKDPSEVEMYKCENCSYETKHKRYLKTHNMLIHMDPSEVTMYKCEMCSFETKYKMSLKKHMLLHIDPFEMFKCENLDCEIKEEANPGPS